MRTFILTLAIVAGVLLIPATQSVHSVMSGPAFGAVALEAHTLDAQQAPVINVEVNKGGGSRNWYANPLWIAVGVLGLLVVIVLIVMAAKGGGTTVVKG